MTEHAGGHRPGSRRLDARGLACIRKAEADVATVGAQRRQTMRRNGRSGMATIPDVARQSGVSTATAARALGGYGSVSPATYQRVLDAANSLGYRPNSLARSMI